MRTASTCLECPNGHDPIEVLRYHHLPTIVIRPCRFDDAEYMAEVRRLLPDTQFIPAALPPQHGE